MIYETVGAIFASKVDVVSSPIIGQNAVYVIQVSAIDEPTSNGDFTAQKSNIQRRVISNATKESYNALKEAANVQDNRADFY